MDAKAGERGGQAVKLDSVLLQQVEIHCSGANIHTALNLMAGYITAVRELKNGDEDFRPIATEAEKQLRALLVKLRLERWPDFG